MKKKVKAKKARTKSQMKTMAACGGWVSRFTVKDFTVLLGGSSIEMTYCSNVVTLFFLGMKKIKLYDLPFPFSPSIHKFILQMKMQLQRKMRMRKTLFQQSSTKIRKQHT